MQASLFNNVSCPFAPFLEEGDTHCFEPRSSLGYEVVSEDHPDFDVRLAEVGNIGFDSVVAQESVLPDFPLFIPEVGGGNGKLLVDDIPEYAATTLARAIKSNGSNVTNDIHKVANLPLSTTVLVLGYAEDVLLEQIWNNRYSLVPKLARLNCIFTVPDYSVFLNQPHPERLINMKRSLIVFDMLQKKGARVVPHMHWFGPKDLKRWANWINQNVAVTMIALDLQMLTVQRMWDEAVAQLHEFIQLLDRTIHFIVTGPSTPERIAQIKDIFSSVTITSSIPIQTAIRHRKLVIGTGGRITRQRSNMKPEKLMQSNTALMSMLAKGWDTRYSDRYIGRHRLSKAGVETLITKPVEIL